MTRTISVDPSVFIGPYPFREVPHPDPEILVKVLERENIAQAWVGHLPAAWEADPTGSNETLFAALAPYQARLRAAPTIRPDRAGWEAKLEQAMRAGAAAIRAYPAHWGMKSDDRALRDLAVASGASKLPLILTVRFEDLRQRDARDTAGDLAPQVVRSLARSGPDVRLIVSAAGKDFIEEVHWGLTPDEQRRVVWDIGWIWGPPEDHLAKLFRRIGSERFVFGSQWPLRLVQAPFANLELLPDDVMQDTLADLARLFN